MLMVVARLRPAEGKADELAAVLKELSGQVLSQEPGCDLYQVCSAQDGDVVVIERYRDKAALEAHGKSAHFQAAMPKLGSCLNGAPHIEVLKPVL